VLEYFDDIDRKEVEIYLDATSYNPATGQVESGYKFDKGISAFVFQSTAMQGAISDKIVDQSDYIVVYEHEIPKTALMYFNKEWYQVVGADDVLFQDCVWVYGLKRTEKPEVTNE
jgi:hypothetical protein